MPEAVSIDHFSFSYNDQPILRDVSLKVGQGEYAAVIGPNGAGKSTMIKCINRILKGGRGGIKLFGRDMPSYSQKELGRLVGYVPQTRDHEFPYTVYEFVLMARYPYFNPLSRIGREDKQVIDHALGMCGVTSFADRPVSSLSGGEQQKVYLAAALAQQPKILLLDEPTAHLDPKYHVEIQKMICQAARDMGMTVMHVTHDLTHLLFWSQKVIAVKDGQIGFCGRPEEILNNDELYKTFSTYFMTVKPARCQQSIIIPEIE